METVTPGLARIEAYYDAVPRPVGHTEEVGPFTLFVADPATGWQFYARPRLGLDVDVTPEDVRRVLARQVELGVPRAIEWIDEVTPSLLPAVRAAVTVPYELENCPLLVLPEDTSVAEDTAGTRVLAPDDADLPLMLGAVSAGFDGQDEVKARPPGRRPDLVREGLLVLVAAYDASGAVVGGGSAAPRGDIAELMGIAVVAPARHRGLGSATTATLTAACRAAGVRTLFLSAASGEATRIYERLGFQRRGTACILGVGG